MRVFQSVAAALLQRFLSTGQNTFDGIAWYLKSARIHLTGQHWVDKFLLPTLLIHQFERTEQKGEVQLKQLTMKRIMKCFFFAEQAQNAHEIT